MFDHHHTGEKHGFFSMIKIPAFLCALVFLLGFSAAGAGEAEPVTLTVALIWPDEADAYHAPALKTLDEFEAAFPGIRLEVEWYDTDEWKDYGEVLALSDDLPDVFYWNAGGALEELVRSGDILPLDEYLTDEIRDRLIGGALDNMTFDGRVYQLPYANACSCLYCNTALFDRYGVKLPETWDGLLEAVRAFRDAGVTPMALGGGDRWPINLYTDLIALRFVGEEACRACYYRTEGATFLTDAWAEAMEAFRTLIDLGAFPEDAAALTRKDADEAFCGGGIPMYVQGQWLAGSLPEEMRNHTVAVKFPAVQKGYDDQWMGGVAEGFSVSAYTGHRDEAFTACRFLAEGLSRNGFLAGAGLPAWKADYSEEEIKAVNPVLLQIADLSADVESFLLWSDTALPADVAGLTGLTAHELLSGESTPEQWCQDMENIFR